MEDKKLFPRAYNSSVYFLNIFFLGGIISGLGPLIPFLANEMNMHETDFGIVFTSRGIGYMFGCWLIGHTEKYFKNLNNFYCLINFLMGVGAYMASLDLSFY